MIKCCICGQKFKKITNAHLDKQHGISASEFLEKYPNADRGLVPWNKGKTKYTHPSLTKLSQRLARQKSWNFSIWQKSYKERLKQTRKEKLTRNNNLAELIGIILGDGCLSSLPRTESLRVVCNSEQQGYIAHIAALIQKTFNQQPVVRKRKNQKATDIVLYRCNLSRSLNIPCGNKIKNEVAIPSWIKRDKIYSIDCLKGLFETDGCFHEDRDNYTQIIEFKNNCKNLLQGVYQILKDLGYHPQFGKNYIRLARKEEALELKILIDFRKY